MVVDPTSVGIVETRTEAIVTPPDTLALESGRTLSPVEIAYETYGGLNEGRTNAVLVLHALSGDAHAAGYHSDDDGRPGWWDRMIGPGRPIDTDRYFVVSSNILGGCKGSTGPSSTNPSTGRPYGLKFPIITVRDMVEAQRMLMDRLGIDRWLAVTGGSLGGMQALEWALRYPARVKGCIPIATSAYQSTQGIAFNYVGRNAITSDPAWRRGEYYETGEIPAEGLSVARMIGHITYLSEESMIAKFGRRLQDRDSLAYDFIDEFQVESYLDHQGDSFVKRFDANSYLYITKASAYFDIPAAYGGGSLGKAFERAEAAFLLVCFSSDWLYPPRQSREMAGALRMAGKDVSLVEIDAPYGHDSFLLEHDRQGRVISSFLKRLSREVGG